MKSNRGYADHLTDEEYDRYVRGLDTTEKRIMIALRESRFVEGRFPSYSSGAGDLIEYLMDDLREEWGLPRKNGDWWWNEQPNRNSRPLRASRQGTSASQRPEEQGKNCSQGT